MIPKTGNKKWWFERSPNSVGTGFKVKCNDNEISAYIFPDDFQNGNKDLCGAFFNGDVQFIRFIRKDASSEEYFKDNGG